MVLLMWFMVIMFCDLVRVAGKHVFFFFYKKDNLHWHFSLIT